MKGKLRHLKINQNRVYHQLSLTKENSKRYTSSRRTVITDGSSEQQVLKKIVNAWVKLMSTGCIKP